ncbi:MAG: hypothetical protein GVY36_13335 [Verrucomicrobia bacterium]|jgi:Zn-dependent metalloprotease|nr:hypothetical protein [Verrucomicrobiota bacterium]
MKNPFARLLAVLPAVFLLIVGLTLWWGPRSESPEASKDTSAAASDSAATLQANALDSAPSIPAEVVEDDPVAEALADRLANARDDRDNWGGGYRKMEQLKRDPALVPANGTLLPKQQAALDALRWRNGKHHVQAYVDVANRTIRYLEGERLHEAVTEVPEGMTRAEATARDFLATNVGLFLVDRPHEEWDVRRESNGVAGNTAVRFRQKYDGLEVYPSGLTVELDEQGHVRLVTGAYSPTPAELEIDPTLTVDDALSLAREHVTEGESGELETRELLIYAYERKPTLAYKIELRTAIDVRAQVFVDAHSGEIISEVNALGMAASAASGIDNRGVNRAFSAWQDGNQFLLVDTSLPMFDSSSSVPQLEQTRGASFVFTARDAESIENGVFHTISNSLTAWDPDAVAGAHAARESYRFFREVLQRDSLDGQGVNLVTIVDVAFNNAFWDPNNKITVYGTSGTGASYAQSIDVVGHELTHGVITFSANLIYQDQPGALNEGYADIGGSSIEFFSDPVSANWLMGNPDDVGKPFRNMKDPNSIPITDGVPHPARMSQFIVTDQNNGGVHMNSTIPSHAFFLVAEGLPNAIGLRDAQLIFFDALFTKLQPSSKFVDLRLACVASARQLYGDGSPQHQATVAAFDQVEIFAPDNGPNPNPGTPEVPPPLPSVSGTDQGIFSYYDFSWQAYIYGYRDETGSYLLFDASGFPVFAGTTVKPGISANVLVDGVSQQWGVLVTSNNDVYLLDTTTGQGTYLGFQGQIGTAAISRDASVYGFVFVNQFTGLNEPSLSVVNLRNNTTRTYALLAAHNGLNGNTNSQATVLQAGSLEFSPDGEMIFYDAENEIVFGDSGFTAWSVYALDYTRAQPAFISVINPIEGLQIGNMSLGNRFLDRMTFEVAQFEYNSFGQLENSQSTVYALNLNTGELGQISGELDTINGLLLPSFTPDDSAIFFTYPFTNADPQNSGQFVIAPVDETGVNQQGDLLFWPALSSPNDGTVIAGALFRTGEYQGLPVLSVQSLLSSVREDAGQVQMFEVTREGDTSSELPFTFSLTGDGFEPGPLAGSFSAGTSAITFRVRPENDTANTGARVLTFSLLPENYLNINPAQASASVTVLDDDTGGGNEPPYLAATANDAVWWRSAWFGWYNKVGDWRWHTEHGWVLLSVNPDESGMFIYDLGTDRWMWTVRELWSDPAYAFVYFLPESGRTLSGWFVFWRGGVGADRWFTEIETDQSYQAPGFRE